jgi:hypothetical protein
LRTIFALAAALALSLATPALAGGHPGGHGGPGGHFGGGPHFGGGHGGHGGHFWHGRFWGYGIGPCWQPTPYGYVWICD